jgi:hypothetical protein
MRSNPQNPLHFNFIKESNAAKAKEEYLKKFPNGLEQFERDAMRSNSIKRFSGNTSIHSRSRSLSRPKFTAGPGPRVKTKPKPRKRTKKAPTKPKPRPRTIKLSNLNPNLNSPLQLANKRPNTPRAKFPPRSNLSLLDTILKPTNTPKPKSQVKKSNLGIAF